MNRERWERQREVREKEDKRDRDRGSKRSVQRKRKRVFFSELCHYALALSADALLLWSVQSVS